MDRTSSEDSSGPKIWKIGGGEGGKKERDKVDNYDDGEEGKAGHDGSLRGYGNVVVVDE